MTDANLMDADCVHGVAWYECEQCCPVHLVLDKDELDLLQLVVADWLGAWLVKNDSADPSQFHRVVELGRRLGMEL